MNIPAKSPRTRTRKSRPPRSKFALPSHTSDTAPGTLPQPIKRSTKHKTVAYGELLMQRATERRKRRADAKDTKAKATRQAAMAGNFGRPPIASSASRTGRAGARA